MWIFLPFGAFSIVAKGPAGLPEPGMLCVRSRSREELTRLAGMVKNSSPVEVGTGTDYPYRFYASKKNFGAAMAKVIKGIDYNNFKAEAGRQLSPAKLNVLHNIWGLVARSWR